MYIKLVKIGQVGQIDQIDQIDQIGQIIVRLGKESSHHFPAGLVRLDEWTNLTTSNQV